MHDLKRYTFCGGKFASFFKKIFYFCDSKPSMYVREKDLAVEKLPSRRIFTVSIYRVSFTVSAESIANFELSESANKCVGSDNSN